MARLLFLFMLILLAGCASKQMSFDYSSVYVRYVVRGGVVPDDRFSVEYVVSNTSVFFARRFANGSDSYSKSANISVEDYHKLGKYIVDAGVFGMLDVYTPSFSSQMSDRPNAELFVNIGGRNKTVVMRPFVEEYLPGNLQLTISEVKRFAQGVGD